MVRAVSISTYRRYVKQSRTRPCACQSIGSESILCPLVTLEEDDVWKWNTLSAIAKQINQSGIWTAELLTSDAPAVRLCRQQNAAREMPYECVVSEVGLIGLSEPSLPAIAATPSGGLAYQVREFIQAIAEVGGAMVIAAAMTGFAVFESYCRGSHHFKVGRAISHWVLRGWK